MKTPILLAQNKWSVFPVTDPSKWTLRDLFDPYNNSGILINGIRLLLLIAGAAAVIYIILGAYNYLTALGDEKRAETAKNTITWAIIGLVVIFLSAILVSYLWNFLTGVNPNLPNLESDPSRVF